MNEQELEDRIKKNLTKNLSINYKKTLGSYGSSDHIEIQLKLGDKIISETYID